MLKIIKDLFSDKSPTKVVETENKVVSQPKEAELEVKEITVIKEVEAKPISKSSTKTVKAKSSTKKVNKKSLPVKPQRTAKEIATEKLEPYVSILSVDLDPSNIGNGAFELDWNEFFIAKLVRAGYKGNDDAQIVDQWFQDVCRNVVLETFEQYEANNPRPVTGVQRRDLGAGRSEVS